MWLLHSYQAQLVFQKSRLVGSWDETTLKTLSIFAAVCDRPLGVRARAPYRSPLSAGTWCSQPRTNRQPPSTPGWERKLDCRDSKTR